MKYKNKHHYRKEMERKDNQRGEFVADFLLMVLVIALIISLFN